MRFGYQHMAFLGPESLWAAEASECAGEQNKFWEFHDLLFERHGGENQGAFSKDNLKKFAADLKLDAGKFNSCLDAGKFTALVQEQTNNLQALGVQSTPTFLVNDKALNGALPFDQFKQLIETERSKKK